jgi:hypothetical protein
MTKRKDLEPLGAQYTRLYADNPANSEKVEKAYGYDFIF